MKWGWSRALPWPAWASVKRKCETCPASPAPSCKKSGPGRQKKLEAPGTHPYMGLTQFARACGRVLVGGHPDKRPDSRQGWETDGGGWTSPQITLPALARGPLPNSDRQPEAKPANPESPRGTQLKATTERAFLVSPAFHRPAPKRLVLHCRPCGVSPIDGVSGPDVSSAVLRRLHSASGRGRFNRLHVVSAPLAPKGAASHDRAHP
jgi:hypothetical protein